MNAQELKEKYSELYDYMAHSKDPKNMMLFGNVMTMMMTDMIISSPSKAEEYISKLEAVKWKNYLTSSEADGIVSKMNPQAPWTKDQWKAAMEKSGYETEEWPCYNSCSLWVTMNGIMSDSSDTLSKYVGSGDVFGIVYHLSVDRLKDKDSHIDIRHKYGL